MLNLKKAKNLKKDSEELMPIAWHPKKEIEQTDFY